MHRSHWHEPKCGKRCKRASVCLGPSKKEVEIERDKPWWTIDPLVSQSVVYEFWVETLGNSCKRSHLKYTFLLVWGPQKSMWSPVVLRPLWYELSMTLELLEWTAPFYPEEFWPQETRACLIFREFFRLTGTSSSIQSWNWTELDWKIHQLPKVGGHESGLNHPWMVEPFWMFYLAPPVSF